MRYDGTMLLSEMLKVNTTLTLLNLSCKKDQNEIKMKTINMVDRQCNGK